MVSPQAPIGLNDIRSKQYDGLRLDGSTEADCKKLFSQNSRAQDLAISSNQSPQQRPIQGPLIIHMEAEPRWVLDVAAEGGEAGKKLGTSSFLERFAGSTYGY